MVECQITDNLMWLTISRPESANALNSVTHRGLVEGLEDAARNEAVQAVVIAASGERVFSAGADLKEYQGMDRTEASSRRRASLLKSLLACVDFPKPLIAAVHAPGIGAGAMLPLACDQIILAEQAWLSFPEIDLNMPTPIGGSLIAQRTSPNVALKLIQTGGRISASEAKSLGLVDEVIPSDGFREYCSRLAGELARHSCRAYEMNKRWMRMPLRQALIDAAAFATQAHQS